VFDYWSAMHRCPLLQQVALTFLQRLLSSAAAERNFSTNKFIHSDVRNRLSEAHVEKLGFIFFNSKNQSAEDVEIFNLLEDLEGESIEEEISNQVSIYEYYKVTRTASAFNIFSYKCLNIFQLLMYSCIQSGDGGESDDRKILAQESQ